MRGEEVSCSRSGTLEGAQKYNNTELMSKAGLYVSTVHICFCTNLI